jgi:hypothetical protein
VLIAGVDSLIGCGGAFIGLVVRLPSARIPESMITFFSLGLLPVPCVGEQAASVPAERLPLVSLAVANACSMRVMDSNLPLSSDSALPRVRADGGRLLGA